MFVSRSTRAIVLPLSRLSLHPLLLHYLLLLPSSSFLYFQFSEAEFAHMLLSHNDVVYSYDTLDGIFTHSYIKCSTAIAKVSKTVFGQIGAVHLVSAGPGALPRRGSVSKSGLSSPLAITAAGATGAAAGSDTAAAAAPSGKSPVMKIISRLGAAASAIVAVAKFKSGSSHQHHEDDKDVEIGAGSSVASSTPTAAAAAASPTAAPGVASFRSPSTKTRSVSMAGLTTGVLSPGVSSSQARRTTAASGSGLATAPPTSGLGVSTSKTTRFAPTTSTTTMSTSTSARAVQQVPARPRAPREGMGISDGGLSRRLRRPPLGPPLGRIRSALQT